MIDDVIKTMDKITRTILYVNTTKLARLLDFNGEISSHVSIRLIGMKDFANLVMII